MNISFCIIVVLNRYIRFLLKKVLKTFRLLSKKRKISPSRNEIEPDELCIEVIPQENDIKNVSLFIIKN